MADAILTVNANLDDGHETDAGTVTLTTTGLDCDSTGDHIGFIIRDLPVPPGDEVTTAYINVWPNDAGRQSPNVTVKGEVDPADFVASSGNMSGRTKTTAAVSWVASNIGTGAYKPSPSLVSVIQEIVDNPSYAEGDDVAIYLIQNSNSGWFRISAREANTAQAAQLYVEWTTAAPPGDLTYAWPGDYWADGYWSEYWPDYGTEDPEPPDGTIIPLVMHHLKQQGVS